MIAKNANVTLIDTKKVQKSVYSNFSHSKTIGEKSMVSGSINSNFSIDEIREQEFSLPVDTAGF